MVDKRLFICVWPIPMCREPKTVRELTSNAGGP